MLITDISIAILSLLAGVPLQKAAQHTACHIYTLISASKLDKMLVFSLKPRTSKYFFWVSISDNEMNATTCNKRQPEKHAEGYDNTSQLT